MPNGNEKKRREREAALLAVSEGMPSDAGPQNITPQEAEQKDDDAFYRELYEWAQEQLNAQVPMQKINDTIREATGGEVAGFASLEIKVGAPVTEAEQPEIGKGRAALVSAGQGATLGFSDEIIGRVMSLSPNITYEQAVEALRAEQEAAQTQHPGIAFAGEMAGAVLPSILTAGVLGPASMGRAVGQPLLRQGLAAGRVAGRMGAIEGTAYGLGTAEGNPLQRLPGAAIGGVTGAVAGGAMGTAMPFIGAGLRKAGRGLNAAMGEPTMRNPFGEAGPGGMGGTIRPSPAEQQQRILARETMRGVDGPVIHQQMRGNVPDEAVLADLHPNLRAQARRRANEAGGLLTEDIERIAAREESSGSRIVDKLRKLTGIEDTAAQFRSRQKDKVKAYRELMNVELEKKYPAIAHPLVLSALSEPDFAPLLRAEGIKLDGGVITMRQIQALRGRIQAKLTGQRNPNTYQRMKHLLARLDESVGVAVPEYRLANAEYARIKAAQRAFKSGTEAFNKSADEVQYLIEQMPAHARDSFRLGYVTRLESSLLKHEAGGAARTSLLKAGDDMQQAIRQIFPEGDKGRNQYQKFMESLEWEKKFRSTHRELQGGGAHSRQQRGTIDEAMDAQKGDSFFGTVREIVGTIFSGSEAKQDAAALIGKTLLEEGEDAAWQIAYLLKKVPVQEQSQLIRALMGTGSVAAAKATRPDPVTQKGLLFDE